MKPNKPVLHTGLKRSGRNLLLCTAIGRIIKRLFYLGVQTMGGTALKNARMELKTTDDVKDIIVRAAALIGIDATAFVLGLAAERAQQVIASHSTIQLNLDGQRRFAELLKNPPKRTKAMVALNELPDFEENI